MDDRPTSGFTGKRLALVDQVDFIPIRDSSVRAAALERGDVDVALALTQQDVDRYKGKPGLTVAAKPGISFSDLRFGFKKGIFMENPKLRQAVAYAMDKEESVKAVTFGLGTAERITGLRVIWPDGSRQEVAVPAVDTVVRVEQTAGP